MATIERRSKRFRLIFYHLGRRHAASLKTTNQREADAIAGSVERTLQLLEQRVLQVPDGADLVTYVLSGGKQTDKPKPPPIRTLKESHENYRKAHELGAMEANSLDTVMMHLRHFAKTLGNGFPVQSLDASHIQQHIDRRCRQKGIRKKFLSTTTLKKEVATMRACWNWGVAAGLLHGLFPLNKSLKYPKSEEKEPFQTWEEIERKISRGGLSVAEIRELWDSLFLTLPEIEELLRFVEANARHDFLYPMFVFAAHTGCRRSEILRARLDDVDFAGHTVLIRERKRAKNKRTHRRVPLSSLLEQVLRNWIAHHPGGQCLFCHRLTVPGSKKRRVSIEPLTRNEAHDHFTRTLAESKWTTRQPRRPRQRTAEVEMFAGNTIPNASGRGRFPCSALNADVTYAGFNGNGKRAGLGYYLTTAGGWLKKAGYAPAETSEFLTDLSVLQDALDLTVIGLEKSSNRCHDLEGLRALSAAAALHATLEQVLVRVYTRADYAERWNQFFNWGGITPEPLRQGTEEFLALVAAMRRQGISRRALADGIGADPSFLSKLFNGRKKWPADLLARSQAWLANRREDAGRPPVAAWPSLPTMAEGKDCLLDVALAYRERGWSVVPQRPGDKKPTIRWKPYQEVLPSRADLQSWFRQWPSAGLAVVLGPVSDLFVIDVDGSEAHAALLRHLSEEPEAPKAISGSRKPDRYHLFFRCPDRVTKAKATPWHPQLEFRGQGGIVVIPSSVHKSGHRYEWAARRSPADLPFPEVPEPILAALQTKGRTGLQGPVAVVDGLRVSASTRRFLAGNDANGPQWNDRLFQAACDLAGRGVAQETAEPLLLAGARPWNETEHDKALRTIRSAYIQPRVPGEA